MTVEHTSVDVILREVDEFFMAEGPVHKTMRSLAMRLSQEGIDYALVGGMSLVLHGYRRETVDVDILLSKEGYRRFIETVVGRGYVPLFPGSRKAFRDAETGVGIDVLTEGEYPGDGKPKPVSFPSPSTASTEIDGIRILNLEKVIELKLASGMTAPHRLRDLADVQELIRLGPLGSEFSERLDPYVRDKYLELWSAIARADDVEGPGDTSSVEG